MTSKCALAIVLLQGDIVNIRNIHQLTGFTNAAREIGRCIERDSGKGNIGFGVTVSRSKMEGKNRFGIYSTWNNYRLNKSAHNLPGIKKMAKYVIQEIGEPKTEQQRKIVNQLKRIC